MGVKHFCIGWDVRILADWWDTKGAEMRQLLATTARKPAAKPMPRAKARANGKGNGRAPVRGNYA
jgi:4-hydroxy-2-oxoheptanedioate aldolase